MGSSGIIFYEGISSIELKGIDSKKNNSDIKGWYQFRVALF